MAAMVGGASVITFPVLLAVGLPPITATASNLVAVSAGNLLAAMTDRANLPPLNRAFVGLVAASLVGALIGAVLLLATPTRMFEQLIPLLLGFATILFGFAGRITQWMRARAKGRGHGEWRMSVTSVPLILPISVYGGYFGGGIGFLMLAALTAAGLAIRSANATKNVLAGVMNASAVAIFVFSPQVHWLQGAIACVGAALGGVIGGHMVNRVNQKVLRGAAVAIGVALTIGLFIRAP